MINVYEIAARCILEEAFFFEEFIFIFRETETPRTLGDMTKQGQQARVCRRFLRQVYGHLQHPNVFGSSKTILGEQQYLIRAKY